MKLLCLFPIAFLFLLTPAFAQPGSLDNSFDSDGIRLYLDPGYNTPANAMLIRPDNSLLTVGERFDGWGSQLLMLSFQPDGRTDSSFGRYNVTGNPTWGYPGIVHTDIPGSNREYANAAVLMDDGRILIGGYANTGFDWLLARYKTNGDLDSSFASVGYVIQDWNGFEILSSLHVQPNGKILASGAVSGGLGVARFNDDGSLDAGFGNSGLATMPASNPAGGDMAVDGSGNIFLCGTASSGNNGAVVVGKFSSNGSPDNSFGANGVATITLSEFPTEADLALIAGGKILIAADDPSNFGSQSKLLLARLQSDGSLDTGFDGDGKRSVTLGSFVTPKDLLVQPDGKILVCGRLVENSAADMFVAKFQANGQLDAAFGNGGIAKSGLGTDLASNYATGLSLALQNDGKVLLGGLATLSGLSNLALLRFNNEVGPSTGLFEEKGAVITLSPYPNPAREFLYLDLPEGHWEAFEINDLTGSSILKAPIPPQVKQLAFPVRELSQGMYVIQVSGSKGLARARFLR